MTTISRKKYLLHTPLFPMVQKYQAQLQKLLLRELSLLLFYNYLVDVLDIFKFFCSGAGEMEEASEEVAGGAGFNKK